MGRSPYPQQISYLDTSKTLRLVLRTQPHSEVEAEILGHIYAAHPSHRRLPGTAISKHVLG
jgi:hypothetical protein